MNCQSANRVCLLIFFLALVQGLVPLDGTAAEPERPLVVAHRGLLLHAPENTLANFRACLELQCGFEFDVQRTKDGHLVCLHDDTLERTTSGKGRVAETTLAELQKLDAGRWFDARFAGEKIPTIEETLALVAEHRQHQVLICVDLKAEGVEQDVVGLAEKHNVLDRLLFIGRAISEPSVRRALREASAKSRVAALAAAPENLAEAIADADSDWVYLRYVPTPAEVASIHRSGKRTFIAGVTVSGNSPDNWQKATTAGLDGILTDYPLELQATLRAAELKSPAAQP
jgi:glycerophosphoryl diester phosphodiesterase